MNNFWIVAPQNLPWACRSDRLSANMDLPPNSEPPPESYATLEEAIDRLQGLFEEVARKTFDPELLEMLPPEAISVYIVLADSVLAGNYSKPTSKAKIIREFKKHPSVPIAGIVHFWKTEWEIITCVIQGKKEIDVWLESPEAKEISGVVKSLNADAIVASGIYVT